jgi:GTP cyclohydrolase IA
MRGVEKQNSVAVTSAMLGGFRQDARTRMEFLELIRRPELNDRPATMSQLGLACVTD